MKKIWILLAVFISCSSPNKEVNDYLSEAAEFHDAAIKTGHDLSLRISQIKQIEEELSKPDQDTLQVLMKDLGEWYDSVVEVPGHEHGDHDHHGHDHEGHDHHDHDHDHDHGPNYLEGLSEEQILEIQKELKKEIDVIGVRIRMLNDRIRNK